MKKRKPARKLLSIILLCSALLLPTGCYDRFEEYVMDQMGIGETTTEVKEEKTSSVTAKETPKASETAKSNDPFLHEPSDKFNTVRFADASQDGIHSSDWVCYEKGCWWEMETDIDGREVSLILYGPDGKELESVIPTYGTGQFYSHEILACYHYQGYKEIGRWEKKYNMYGELDYYREYNTKGILYSQEFVYHEVVPERDGWVTPYNVLDKIVETTYKDGAVADKKETPVNQRGDKRAKGTVVEDLHGVRIVN